jgi:predicted ATPase
VQAIVAKGEGNPFFLEELARAVGDSDAPQWRPSEVPATVQGVLAARIDRLPPTAKQLLQMAAVIGKDVPLPLLQTVAGLPEERLYQQLARLQAGEFLCEIFRDSTPAYTFTHALTQEVAYGSLLRGRRHALHRRIMEAIEAFSPNRLVDQVECLAHHALKGEVWDKAVAYCRQAGEKAMAQSSYREAVGSVEQALRALAHLPEPRVTLTQAIDLRLALGGALRPLGDSGRILAALREAESLAVALDDPRRLSRISRFLSFHFYTMGAHDQAVAAAQRALTLATAGGVPSCRRGRTAPSASPTRPRAPIVGRSTASGRPWRPPRGRSAASASVGSSCPPCTPGLGSPCATPSWAHFPRVGPSEKRGSK